MLVAAAPRSGATQFCQNLSFQRGIPFRGELTYYHMQLFNPTGNNLKAAYHESGFQPTYTTEQYLNLWQSIEDPSSIVLYNYLPNVVPILDKAEFIIVRKTPRYSAYSFVNWALNSKAYQRAPYTTYDFYLLQIGRILMDCYFLYAYANSKRRGLTFYEDFSTKVNPYTTLREQAFFPALKTFTDNLLARFNFSALHSEAKDLP